MPQREKPWTTAIREHLEKHAGEWIDKAEVLRIGAEQVPDDVAQHEMRNRQGKLTPERLLAAGRQSKALQGLMGQRRFGKLSESPDGRQVRWLGKESYSLGEVGRQGDEMMARLELLEDLVRSQQAQLDRLDRDDEPSTASEDFVRAVGLDEDS